MKYFTSDTHFDHCESNINKYGLVFEFRPLNFSELFIDIINQKVGKEDTLYIIGDFAFKKPGKWRQLINCKTVYLIMGNHDPIQKSQNVFGGNLRQIMEIKICGVRTWLSHYPHAIWPASHHGSYHLFGHTHNNRENRRENYNSQPGDWFLNEIWPEKRSMDVCPESYRERYGDWGIFSEIQINDILSARKGHDNKEFYKRLRGEDECVRA